MVDTKVDTLQNKYLYTMSRIFWKLFTVFVDNMFDKTIV